MIEIKQGTSLGVRIVLKRPSGTDADLRRARELSVWLQLPSGETMQALDSSIDRETNTVYARTESNGRIRAFRQCEDGEQPDVGYARSKDRESG